MLWRKIKPSKLDEKRGIEEAIPHSLYAKKKLGGRDQNTGGVITVRKFKIHLRNTQILLPTSLCVG